MTRRWATRVATVGAVAGVIAFGLLLAPAEAAPPGPLDNATLRSVCTNCHTLDRIDRQSLDRAGWEAIIARMREYMQSAGGSLGSLSDEQATEVLDHLVDRRGPDHGAEPWATTDLIRSRCSQCHGLDRILTVRKTPEAWAASVEKMRWYASRNNNTGRGDAVTLISEEEGREIADWLARERPLLAEEVAAGSAGAEPVLMRSMCTTCHDMASVRNTVKSPEEWAATVRRMQDFRSGWSVQWSNRFSSLRNENRQEAIDQAIQFLSENRQANTEAWERFEERRRRGVDLLAGSWSVFGSDNRGSFRGTIAFTPVEGQRGVYTAVRSVTWGDGQSLRMEGEAKLFGDALRETFKVRREQGSTDILGSAFEDDVPADEEGNTSVQAALTLNEDGTYAQGSIGGENQVTSGREVYVRGAPPGAANPDDFAPPEGAAINPAVLFVEPPVVKRGETVKVTITGFGFPAGGVPADAVSLGDGVTIDSIEAGASSPVTIVASVTAGEDAPLGVRPARVNLESGPVEGSAFAVIDGVDHVRIIPTLGLARVGGEPPHPDRQDPSDDDEPLEKKLERFRLFSFSNGPDGEPYTDDDVRIGPVTEGIAWASMAVDIHRSREFTPGEGDGSEFDLTEENSQELHLIGMGKYRYVENQYKQPTIGSIDQNGLFTPGSDRPEIDLTGPRGRPDDESTRNNTGDNRGTTRITAKVTIDGRELEAEAVCVVAPPDYVPLVPYYGPAHEQAHKLAADELTRERGN